MSARKQVLAAKHERAAVLALDELLNRLETKPSEIPTTVLNIIGGTSTDKASLLRGENMQTLHHIHSFDITDDDIIAYAVYRSKRAKVIEAESLPPADALPRGTNAAQKAGLTNT